MAELRGLQPDPLKISILSPTRARPVWAWRMAYSAIMAALEPWNVEILLGVDLDDPQHAGYVERDQQRYQPPHGEIAQYYQPAGRTVSETWNDLAARAKGDIMLMGNDDLLFETIGWDEAFRRVHREYSDSVYVAWADDAINGETHCAFPCVSRGMFEALGYFAPPVGFRFFRNDTWMYDLGRRVGRCHYVSDVMIRHLHWTHGGIKDETTDRARTGGQAMHDQRLWAKTEDARISAARVLEGMMGKEAEA